MPHQSFKTLRPLQWYKALKTAEGRREQQAFLIEGLRNLEQVALASPLSLLEIITTEPIRDAKRFSCPVYTVTPRQYEALSLSKNSPGPLAVVTLPSAVESDAIPSSKRIVVLEDVQDPGNVGTLIRDAAAFDFDGVLCNTLCADPFGPKAAQASAGSLLSLWIRRVSSLPKTLVHLKTAGFSLIATDLDGIESHAIPFAAKTILVLGNEGNGLTDAVRSLADTRLKIPINQHKAQSLNVAACGAICMYEIARIRS